jgi:putative hydrolase of the HAD superfamily
MIRTLLFDLGNVLVKLDFERAYRAAAKLRGCAPEEVQRLLREADLAGPYERGEIDSEEFHSRCEELLGLGLDFDGFSGLWGDMFSHDELVSPEFIRALGGRYRLAILSNTNPLHYEWLRREYPILELFPQAVLSYEVGAMKPARAMYEAALETTLSRPEECFFIDDRAENVEGARASGIHAEVFRGQTELEEALRSIGVRW